MRGGQGARARRREGEARGARPGEGRREGRGEARSGAPVDAGERAAWRAFQQLGSVGPATAGDLVLLGFRRIEQLRGQDARELFARMCVLTNSKQDPCVEDVFRCVIAQAEHEDLPARLQQWHLWTPLRGQPPGTMPPGTVPKGPMPKEKAARAQRPRPSSRQ